MALWEHFVGVLGAALFVLAQAYGGNLGLAIITLSLCVRLTLLPVTIRLARRAEARQAKLLELQPEIRRLTARYRSDPQWLNTELFKLYRRHQLSPLDLRSFLGNLVQLPFGAGLYTAISRGLGEGGRFLWIANLARPDTILALLIGALTYITSVFVPGLPLHSRLMTMLVPALLTVLLAWTLASGVGLYWATSTVTGALQFAVVRRSSR